MPAVSNDGLATSRYHPCMLTASSHDILQLPSHTISRSHPLRHSLATPISPRRGTQRDKRRRMLARKPKPTLGTAFPQRLDILVQLHVVLRTAGLKRGVRAPSCKFVVLPVRRDDAGGCAFRERGGIAR